MKSKSKSWLKKPMKATSTRKKVTN